MQIPAHGKINRNIKFGVVLRISAYQQQTCYTPKKNVNFKAHPDFFILKNKYPDKYNVSCYFRHGIFAVPGEEYKDVFRALRKVFLGNFSKKKMLIGGIGDSQESFSHLASIKSITGKPLKDVVDLYVVDIKDKPDDKLLFKQSFYDGEGALPFAKDSFIATKKYRKLFGMQPKFRVDDEIYEYLRETYSNPQKSKWETRIQDAMKEYPDENFDIISINNVLQYIPSQATVKSTLSDVVRVEKSGGVFITDSFESTRNILLDTNKMDWFSHGIYSKK